MISLNVVKPYVNKTLEDEQYYIKDSSWQMATRIPPELYEEFMNISDQLVAAAERLGSINDTSTLLQQYLATANTRILNSALYLLGDTPISLSLRFPGDMKLIEILSSRDAIDPKIINRIKYINNRHF